MNWMDSDNRYGMVSRVIHWLMAALLILMLFSEAWMEALGDHAGEPGMAWHQSIGITLLVLLVGRLAWRALNRGKVTPPERWRTAARLGHLALYGVMLAIPLTGALTALGEGHGIELFGWGIVAPGPEIEWMEEAGEETHEVMANLLWVILAGHVLAALAHQHLLGDNTLRKMA